MSNENNSAEDFSLCDRVPFDYVSCQGLRETRSCYHTRRSVTAHWTNVGAPFRSTDRRSHHYAFPTRRKNLGRRRPY